MARIPPLRTDIGMRAILFLLIAMAGFLILSRRDRATIFQQSPRLLSIQPLGDAEICPWVPTSAGSSLLAALQQQRAARESFPSNESRAEVVKRTPIRTIRDPHSAYSAVAVDPVRNEVVMADENLFSILVYDRLETTPPKAKMSEPKRMIQGEATDLEYQCGVYVDPATGDIYTINNDTRGRVGVFSRTANGNVRPDRSITTPVFTFGLAVDEKHKELLLTVQEDAAVVVYNKYANGDQPPIRLLQGARTGLADPHGITIDPDKDLMYVSNWGSVYDRVAPPGGAKTGSNGRGNGHPNWPIGHNYAVPGSGKLYPPSITVYPRDAKGDSAPLRVIQGARTRLNWPTSLAVNAKTGELFVANDTDHSVIIFDGQANGDVAPIRVLTGPKTLIQNPVGVHYDSKNDELWVVNFGNHSATVYRGSAGGDTPPLRVIRSGPPDAPAPMMGNPNPVAYDSKRGELLIAN